jgi:DNA-directed RNA polymerase sigma subunit (sigma70/sigma32)
MARRTKIVNRECGLETPTGVAMSELLCRAINDTTNADLLAEDVMRLNPDEVRLLYLRIIEGRSLAETGIMIGNKTNNRPADKERTRQRQNHALRKLRGYAERHNGELRHSRADAAASPNKPTP